MEYEVEWDEDSEQWCVFRGEKCIATWSSKELAEECTARLRPWRVEVEALGLVLT